MIRLNPPQPPQPNEPPPVVYRIRLWDEMFTNSESRKVKRPTWIPVGIDRDRRERRHLMKHGTAGVAAYGVLIRLAMIVARNDQDGVLHEEGHPMEVEDISDVAGVPYDDVKRALGLLVTVGYLEKFQLDEQGNLTPYDPARTGLFNTPKECTGEPRTEAQTPAKTEPPAPPGDAPGSRDADPEPNAATSRGHAPAAPRRSGGNVPRDETRPRPRRDERKKDETRVSSDSSSGGISGSGSGSADADDGQRQASYAQYRLSMLKLRIHAVEANTRQFNADMTTWVRVFEEYIWPEGEPEPNDRCVRQGTVITQAEKAKANAKNPMAYWLTAVRKALKPVNPSVLDPTNEEVPAA